jgi:enoyl-CoA hydratase
MCDIILAAPNAKFGQPEINLGIIPGGGGSQRLARVIGKSRTMELILTGRNFSAEEAEKWGVVSRIVGPGEGEVVKEAIEVGKLIAGKGQISVQAAKEAVNAGKLFLIPSTAVSVLIQRFSFRFVPVRGCELREKTIPQSLCHS